MEGLAGSISIPCRDTPIFWRGPPFADAYARGSRARGPTRVIGCLELWLHIVVLLLSIPHELFDVALICIGS